MSENIKLRDETKKQVRSLLISAQHGLTVHELLNDFKNIIGENLPFRKLGFTSAEDLLRDWPDVAEVSFHRGQVVFKGVADESTKNVQRLVSRQKSPKKKSLMMPGGRQALSATRNRPPRMMKTVPVHLRTQIRELLEGYDNGLMLRNLNIAFSRKFGCHLNYQRYGFKSVFEFLRSLEDIVDSEETRAGGVRVHLRKQSNRNNAGNRNDTGSRNDSGNRNNTSNDDPVESLVTVEDDGVVPGDIKQNVKKVLSRRPKGIFSSRFIIEYKELIGRPLPFTTLGFNSVVEFASVIEDIVTIERPSKQGDWLLFDADLRPKSDKHLKTARAEDSSAETTPSEDQSLHDRVLDSHTIDKIWQVLACNSDGTDMTLFLDVYRNLTEKELNVQEYGYSTLEDFLHSMPSVVKLVYKGQGKMLLFAVDQGREVRHELLPGLCKLNNPKSSASSGKSIPCDAVGHGSSYPTLKFSCKVGSYFDVFVSNIISPSRIWLQIRGDSTTLALEELMDKLEEVYDSSMGDSYVMPNYLIAIGQVCVAIFPEDENWHRVIISGIPNMDFVEVLFVDYGNSCCVHRANLRLLKSKFLHLPAQAIGARLSNIGPVEPTGWSLQARELMLKLCANRPLVALLYSLKGNEISVCLCDTSSETDIHINDTLVLEGLAQFTPDTPPEGNPATAEKAKENSADCDNCNYEGQVDTAEHSCLDCQEYLCNNCSKIHCRTKPTRQHLLATLSDIAAHKHQQDIRDRQKIPCSSHPEENVGLYCISCDKDSVDILQSDALKPTSLPVLEDYLPRHQQPPVNEQDLSHQLEHLRLQSTPLNNSRPQKHHVKFVRLVDNHQFHIINVKGEAYVATGEISAFLWYADLLRSMLRSKGMDVPKLVLAEEEHPDLFNELQSYKIKGFSEDSRVKSKITVYKLANIPDILTAFDCMSHSLIQAIRKEVTSFDPSDTYWTGAERSTSSTGDRRVLSDLEHQLAALQTERHSILNELIKDSQAVSVDQLYLVENQIKTVKAKMSELSVKLGVPSSVGPVKPPPRTNVVTPMSHTVADSTVAHRPSRDRPDAGLESLVNANMKLLHQSGSSQLDSDLLSSLLSVNGLSQSETSLQAPLVSQAGVPMVMPVYQMPHPMLYQRSVNMPHLVAPPVCGASLFSNLPSAIQSYRARGRGQPNLMGTTPQGQWQ